MRARVWAVPVVGIGVAAAAFAAAFVRARRRAVGELSAPERVLERGLDAAQLAAETGADLTRPPGTTDLPAPRHD